MDFQYNLQSQFELSVKPDPSCIKGGKIGKPPSLTRSKESSRIVKLEDNISTPSTSSVQPTVLMQSRRSYQREMNPNILIPLIPKKVM